MALARDLLVRGETDAVLDYFERLRSFWEGGCDGTLDEWSAIAKRGEIPDFGANLMY
jgi:hypothetical protein